MTPLDHILTYVCTTRGEGSNLFVFSMTALVFVLIVGGVVFGHHRCKAIMKRKHGSK